MGALGLGHRRDIGAPNHNIKRAIEHKDGHTVETHVYEFARLRNLIERHVKNRAVCDARTLQRVFSIKKLSLVHQKLVIRRSLGCGSQNSGNNVPDGASAHRPQRFELAIIIDTEPDPLALFFPFLFLQTAALGLRHLHCLRKQGVAACQILSVQNLSWGSYLHKDIWPADRRE